MKTHGMYGTKTYKSWVAMKDRCNNKRPRTRKSYYDKGISYCEKWETFEGFYVDMGNRPKKTTLDRLDNSKGYCKENCRWATFKQQARNTTRTTLVKGKTLSEWSEILGIKRSTLAQRYYVYGWSVDRVLSASNKH
jgi:collagenase-like PrtC family protease